MPLDSARHCVGALPHEWVGFRGVDSGWDAPGVWGFVLENLFRVVLSEEIARFLPFVAGNHLLSYANDLESPHALAIALTRVENALVFGGYTAAALAVGTMLLYRRDVE